MEWKKKHHPIWCPRGICCFDPSSLSISSFLQHWCQLFLCQLSVRMRDLILGRYALDVYKYGWYIYIYIWHGCWRNMSFQMFFFPDWALKRWLWAGQQASGPGIEIQFLQTESRTFWRCHVTWFCISEIQSLVSETLGSTLSHDTLWGDHEFLLLTWSRTPGWEWLSYNVMNILLTVWVAVPRFEKLLYPGGMVVWV